MAYLATVEPDTPVSATQVAAHLHASPSYLSKVLQSLAKSALINSVRGAKGGFSLAKKPSEINLLQVVHAVVGPFSEDSCLLGKRICEPGDCKLGALRQKVTGLVERELGEMTLSRFVRQSGSPGTPR